MIRKERITGMGLLVRLVNDHIIVEHDGNDKMLIDALLQAGIPRESIILAYAGESIPREMDVIPESYLKIAFAS